MMKNMMKKLQKTINYHYIIIGLLCVLIYLTVRKCKNTEGYSNSKVLPRINNYLFHPGKDGIDFNLDKSSVVNAQLGSANIQKSKTHDPSMDDDEFINYCASKCDSINTMYNKKSKKNGKKQNFNPCRGFLTDYNSTETTNWVSVTQCWLKGAPITKKNDTIVSQLSPNVNRNVYLSQAFS